MYLFQKLSDLQRHLHHLRERGFTIGFTPTMGALHLGHLSLIKSSLEQCDVNVCCIFVNPTQFNDAADLKKYPRPISRDIDLLTAAGNDILFLPAVAEIYPKGFSDDPGIDFAGLDQVMEGAFRPGHFKGVAQVVKRLLDIVQPHKLYMGQKDFQQLTIIRHLLDQLDIPTELVMCPIVREDSGLAYSSRNVRLSPKLRRKAALIHQVLLETRARAGDTPPKALSARAMQRLSEPEFRPEYVSIVDGISLQEIDDFKQADMVVACAAVWVGDVRLIDNIILKPGD